MSHWVWLCYTWTLCLILVDYAAYTANCLNSTFFWPDFLCFSFHSQVSVPTEVGNATKFQLTRNTWATVTPSGSFTTQFVASYDEKTRVRGRWEVLVKMSTWNTKQWKLGVPVWGNLETTQQYRSNLLFGGGIFKIFHHLLKQRGSYSNTYLHIRNDRRILPEATDTSFRFVHSDHVNLTRAAENINIYISNL